MSTITQRIASAFVVLCGRYGDVTKMAHDREQSRQSLYREASQVANAVDGTAVQSRIDELQRQLAGQQAQIQDLQERLEHAIEITRDKQDEFASVAQAEGVSLSVARRLLQVVAGSVTTPSVPTLGRATEEAGQRAGQLLEVIDEVAQPKVKQATADEIFPGARQLVRRFRDQAALRTGSGNARSGRAPSRRQASSSPFRRAASSAAKASTPCGDQLIPWCLQRADTAQSLYFSTRVLAIHNPARCRCW